jgi:hypothetical protein
MRTDLRIEHHVGECTAARDTPDPADAWQDYFCACHRFHEPVTLENGNVAWPNGWTRAQAWAWRRRHRLVPPEMAETG